MKMSFKILQLNFVYFKNFLYLCKMKNRAEKQ